MIKVTLADKCGFVVTTPTAILAFDYTRDPSHVLHKALTEQKDAPVFFFTSRENGGHYATEIYKLAQDHKRMYIQSNAVSGSTIPSSLGIQVAGMSDGDVLYDLPGGISVRAYGFDDRGVNFMVTTKEGKTIFYGGAITELYENGRQEELGKRYTRMVNRIAGEYPKVDVAILPVDVAEGVDYAMDTEQFLDRVHVASFVPMDFGGQRAEDACNFKAYVHSEDTTGYCLSSPGKQAQIL